MTAATLAEPTVLAHTKRRLFPDDGADGYAVTDTQFAVDSWGTVDVAERVRETLAPFNHVRLASGYPDLVGVRVLGSDLLAVDRLGEEPPLVAVEAKGYVDGVVDAERGIIQAHDRLGEANVAFLAAPSTGVSQSARSLARELNVGVLGVGPGGTVEVLERPRVVGARSTDETTAIRFQASAQGVADQSFGLNHPKNYLGYPLAHYADADTAALLDRYDVVRAVDGARKGAAFLGLVDEHPDGPRLTPLGAEVVRFGVERHETAEDALAEFANWYRSRTRFADLAPEWGALARRVVFEYPAVKLLVEELQALHHDGFLEPTLRELVAYLHETHPAFTVELFVRGTEEARRRVLTPDGDLDHDALADGNVYHSPTVFQLKAICYHAGVLTERGREPHRLDPTSDVWALRTPLD